MPVKWQRLRLSSLGYLPPLLFRYSFAASGYELYMTDLNYIWSERLDRNAILKRADQESTTIDPSEDQEQFNVLLQKIGEALQNEPGSTSVLTPKTQGSAHALELTVTSKLPAPLEPLQWRLLLSKEPQVSTTSHLLLPFVRVEGEREARQQSLIEELGKKDWILGKLFDKIEAMGIELSTIFPGTSGLRTGRKGPMLAQAAKYIKGVAPFNQQVWLEEVTKGSTDSQLVSNIVKEISGDSRVSKQLDSLKPAPDGWWKELTIPDKTPRASTPQKNRKKAPEAKPDADSRETDTDAGTETDDDEFERQETPPRLKKPSEAVPKAATAENDEETQPEGEGVNLQTRVEESRKHATEEKSPSPAIRPKTAPTGKLKGLGKIGGKKQTKWKEPSSPTLRPSISEKRRPSPQPPMQQASQPPATDGDEETDDELQTPQSRSPQKAKEPAKSAPKPSRGLGVIGGKKKEPEPKPDPESKPEPELAQAHEYSKSPEPEAKPQTQLEQKKRKPLGKLGVIGGSKAKAKSSAGGTCSSHTEGASPAPKHYEDEETKERVRGSPSNQDTVSKPTPLTTSEQKMKKETPAPAEPHDETEQEKADRRREELKRQLEAKSKAPAKKKRRF
ncbi:uncharacterized protein BJX67DRAFT_380574 [Aspergillus lucknowensis]|uniref:Non-homologous end-joining factor 1 n=1 Tax=Aspergillus lucknowensis TaxID=176173 RepID=A0ABR4LU39_9EURO